MAKEKEIMQPDQGASDESQSEAGKCLHPTLEGIRQIMPGLVRTLGADCELVLHDFKDVSHSLVAIEGLVTGRSVGSPLTDMILKVIRREKDPQDLLNYQSHTIDGRPMRSSTLFIRDSGGKLIGCLCVNRDLSKWVVVRELLNDFYETRPLGSQIPPDTHETFVQDVEELLMGTINEVISLGQKPVKDMEKADKIRVVRELDARGMFLIRGAVETVAKVLRVTRYTIYNYLDEGRRQELEASPGGANHAG